MAMLKRKREADLLVAKDGNANNYNTRGQFYTDEDGEAEYNKAKVRVKRRAAMSVEPAIPRTERFSLTGSQRLHLVVVGFAAALSYGRASNELMASTEWGDIASSIVSIATVASRCASVSHIYTHSYYPTLPVKLPRDSDQASHISNPYTSPAPYAYIYPSVVCHILISTPLACSSLISLIIYPSCLQYSH